MADLYLAFEAALGKEWDYAVVLRGSLMRVGFMSLMLFDACLLGWGVGMGCLFWVLLGLRAISFCL